MHRQAIVNKIYSYFCTTAARVGRLSELCHLKFSSNNQWTIAVSTGKALPKQNGGNKYGCHLSQNKVKQTCCFGWESSPKQASSDPEFWTTGVQSPLGTHYLFWFLAVAAFKKTPWALANRFPWYFFSQVPGSTTNHNGSISWGKNYIFPTQPQENMMSQVEKNNFDQKNVWRDLI